MSIDKGVLKFIVALLIVGVVVELTDSVSRKAAYTMVVIIVLGILLNNPLALGLISVGANSLGDQAK